VILVLDLDETGQAAGEMAEDGVSRLLVFDSAVGARKEMIHAPTLRAESDNWVSLSGFALKGWV
jgi:hypothetical protein